MNHLNGRDEGHLTAANMLQQTGSRSETIAHQKDKTKLYFTFSSAALDDSRLYICPHTLTFDLNYHFMQLHQRADVWACFRK